MKNGKVKTAITFSAIAIILAIVIAVTAVYFSYLPLIDGYLFSTQALDDETRQEGEALAEQIEAEGIVMVQNNDNVLPLDRSSVTRVNVLGWSSTQWIMGGSGSGRSVQSQNNLNPETDFLTALENYEISYNTALTDMYESYLNYRPYWDGANDGGSLHSYDYEFCRLYEPSVSDSTWYTDEIKTYTKGYSDTAIVVIGRVAGESVDCPKVQYKGYATGNALKTVSDSTRTYLDISTEEEELLTWAGQNFNNVIVVINSTNAMNLGFLETISGIDSCIIVGGTGNNAVTAIPKILYGEISPSGRTVDTYVYDFSTNPSYAYSGSDGVGAYTDDDGCYPIGETNGNVSGSAVFDTVSYLDYVEGIYVGYKWYETADADGFWNSATASSYWGVSGYDEVVQYPFGYGLTYTTFTYEIEDVSPSSGTKLTGDETITVKVKVTNTGSYTAKDVLQLYFSVPYTKGGIEKSAVTLAAYEKVELDSGESQVLELSFDVSDMASYDSQEIKVAGGGYILEAGDYTITVRTDAHTVAAGTSAVTYSVASDIRYTTDPDTGAVVSNLFDSDGSDGIAIDGSDTEGNIPYLSRADFAATFQLSRASDRTMAQELKDTNLYDEDDIAEWMDEHSNATMPTTGANNGATLYNEVDHSLTIYGVALGDPENFDSEVWDLVLDNLTISEMRSLVLHGYAHEEAISSVGKLRTLSVDGPAQIGSFNQSQSGVGYPSPVVLAQTWNTALAESYGLAVGKEANKIGYSGWYAPGINMHRSAFGGRNYEYYSEDSYLSGVMCAAVVQGAAEAGVYTYIKHIIGYDQETLRDGLYCWMTEQTLREVYLKPFKIAVENGAMGLMSSYGRVGAVWSGGSEALLTDLLRDEWGFKGAVLTDYSDHHNYMNCDQMLLAGGDLWMDYWNDSGEFNYLGNSSYDSNAAFVTQLRNAAKHVLYSVLNAQYVANNYDETGATTTGSTSSFNWITPIVIAVDVAALAGCGVWAGFTIKRIRKNKKTQADA